VQFTSQESKMADNKVEIGLLLLLSCRNRRRKVMQRQTKKTKKGLDKRLSLLRASAILHK